MARDLRDREEWRCGTPRPTVRTGYLTIAEYNAEDYTYRLDYPDREVRESFSRCVVESFANQPYELTGAHLTRLVRALRDGDVDALFGHLRIFFANIPYDIQLANEKYYQTIFHVIFTLVGLRMDCEVRTADGRIDAVAETAASLSP